MLDIYTISPEFLDLPSLGPEHVFAFEQLLFEACRGGQVSLALPREEFGRLVDLVDRIMSLQEAKKCKTYLEAAAASSSPGLCLVSCGESDSYKRSRACVERLRVDHILVNSREVAQKKFGSSHGAVSDKYVEIKDLKECLRAIPKEVALGGLQAETTIRDALGTIVRLKSVMQVIDPYLGKDALANETAFSNEMAALERLVAALSSAALALGQSVLIEIVFGLAQIKANKALRQKVDSGEECWDALLRHAREKFIKQLAHLGISPSNVIVKYCDDFQCRAVRSAGRFWDIKHNLHELGELLKCRSAALESRPSRQKFEDGYPLLSLHGDPSVQTFEALLRRARTI